MTASVEYRHGGTVREPFGDLLTAPSRHDLLLIAIPLVLLAATLVGALSDLSVEASLTGAALVGAGLLVDALFLNPPVDGGGRPDA